MWSLIRLPLPIVLVVLIACAPARALAQSSAPPTASQSAAQLKPEQLEQLAAPIALYPDPLLAQVLMAATYPLEVVAAERFASANKNLKPEELKAQAEKKNWDKNVVALVATPEVLKMMSDKLDWTQQVGDALLAQQADLMDAIQRLRSKAKAQNKLETTKQQVVSSGQEQGKQIITIEPADPETIYVPYYDPAVVYGVWPYLDYPAYYFPWPGYIARGVIAAGIAFGGAYALGRWTSGGNYWGGSVNWGNNNININRPVNIGDRDRVQHFSHNPAHRHGVKYPQQLQQKFANRPGAGDAGQRIDFRGRDGQQVVRPDQGGPGRDRPGGDRADIGRPGGDRPGAGQRPGGGDRPGAGQRPSGGDRPGAGQRPGGGGRPSAGQRPAGGDRPHAGQRPGGGRPQAGQRPSGPRGGGAFADIDRGGGAARAAAARGHASFGGRGGGGGGHFAGGGGRGGGGFAGGGGGGFRGGGGGGRRSDLELKHDVNLLGHLGNGLGYYRFSYLGSDRAYVGVMAQEVQTVRPDAVARGRDGYLRVHYDRLGIKFQTYKRWIADGARMPAGIRAAQ